MILINIFTTNLILVQIMEIEFEGTLEFKAGSLDPAENLVVTAHACAVLALIIAP